MSDLRDLYQVQIGNAKTESPAPAVTQKENLLNQSLALTTAGKLQQFEFLDQEAARLAISRALEAREAAKQAIIKLREAKKKEG